MNLKCSDKIEVWDLEQPLKLQDYNEEGDPEEHLEHVKSHLDYYPANEDIKCKLFARMTKSSRDWYKTIFDGSIYSWSKFYETFTTYLTSRKSQLVSKTVLSVVSQGKKGTLQPYIDRFTKVSIVVGGTDENLKC